MERQPNAQFSEAARLPNFLVIGAMRAGTTTLYQTLRSHPAVHMAAVKEANFFALENGSTDLPLTQSSADIFVTNSVASPIAYSRLFEGAGDAKAIGEVSPSYLYSAGAHRRISERLPGVRLIVVLRDPVDRAYSAYLRRAGVVPDPEMFLKVAEDEHRAFHEGVPTDHYPLLVGGLYSMHLRPYMHTFSSGQIWVRLFEDLWTDHDRSFAELYDFIEVERIGTDAPHLNKSGVPRYQMLDRVLRGGARVKGYTKRHLPARAVRTLIDLKQRVEDRNLIDPERLPASIRADLIDRYFLTDIEQTEALIQRDLSSWRTP